MKLAKKVLATVMAVAMIFALSAIAFAATPTISFSAGEVKDGQVKVSVFFDDAIGLKSWDFSIAYDATILQFKSISKGADAKQCDNLANNSFSSENNAKEAGTVKYSGFFKENLWTAEQFAADASDPDEAPVTINAEHFHAATITFTVLNATAASTDLKVTITKAEGAALTAPDYKVVLNDTEPAPQPADQETTSAVATTVEEGSEKVGPDGHEPDDASTWAIGAAAAVAVLAGAAFVVSKKRK